MSPLLSHSMYVCLCLHCTGLFGKGQKYEYFVWIAEILELVRFVWRFAAAWFLVLPVASLWWNNYSYMMNWLPCWHFSLILNSSRRIKSRSTHVTFEHLICLGGMWLIWLRSFIHHAVIHGGKPQSLQIWSSSTSTSDVTLAFPDVKT